VRFSPFTRGVAPGCVEVAPLELSTRQQSFDLLARFDQRWVDAVRNPTYLFRRLLEIRHHHRPHAGGVGGGDAGFGIFEGGAFTRIDAESGGGTQVDLRIWFAARDLIAGDDGVETMDHWAQRAFGVGSDARRGDGAWDGVLFQPRD